MPRKKVAYWLDHGLSSYWTARAPHVMRWLEPTPDDVVLEIGCGIGRWTTYFGSLVRAMYALDVDTESLAVTLTKDSVTGVVSATAEKLPFGEACFSKIIAVDVIEHVPDDQSMFREMYRVLELGGRVVTTTLVRDRPHYIRRMSFDDHLREYTPEELIQLFEDSGFNILTVFHFYHAPSMLARELQALAEQIPLGNSVPLKIVSVGCRLVVGVMCKLLGDAERILPIGRPSGLGVVAAKELPPAQSASGASRNHLSHAGLDRDRVEERAIQRVRNQIQIDRQVLALDAWLDSMRTPDGYGGPVAHWWQDSLHFTGVGLDWRYEGIILGYLNLYERTGQERWLAKARRAADDLVRGQLPSGNFRNSSFELNPYTGGTPHEAACDLALLCLARVLKEAEDPAWQGYAAPAEKNLRAFVLGVLWDGERQAFGNTVGDPTFVPNKAATMVEALLAWAALSGDEEPAAHYARPTLEAIVACQMRAPGNPLAGGIPQRVDKEHADGRYFPFYIARCIPALVQGAALFGDERYQDAARAVVAFLLRHRLADGSFPQVIYANGRANRYPQWVAGAADILRALDLVDDGGGDGSREATLNWLLAGLQGPSPRTAHGFAAQVSQARPPALPDFRDLLGVVGWADKAFRYLAGLVTPSSLTLTPRNAILHIPCLFHGSEALYHEDERTIEVRRGGALLYRWRKGAAWAEIGPA